MGDKNENPCGEQVILGSVSGNINTTYWLTGNTNGYIDTWDWNYNKKNAKKRLCKVNFNGAVASIPSTKPEDVFEGCIQLYIFLRPAYPNLRFNDVLANASFSDYYV